MEICHQVTEQEKLCTMFAQNPDQKMDSEEEAEYKVGADGTDEYYREVTGQNELSEPEEDY